MILLISNFLMYQLTNDFYIIFSWQRIQEGVRLAVDPAPNERKGYFRTVQGHRGYCLP